MRKLGSAPSVGFFEEIHDNALKQKIIEKTCSVKVIYLQSKFMPVLGNKAKIRHLKIFQIYAGFSLRISFRKKNAAVI
jgi:hypothetical protein